MPFDQRKKIVLAACVLVVCGFVVSIICHSLYLRSDRYRVSVEQSVAHLLGMPIEIGRVVPLSGSSQGFEDIRVYLPSRDEQIFQGDWATWTAIEKGPVQTGSLELVGGWFLLGTGEFSRDDYRAMLQGGLGHNFQAMSVSSVTLDDVDIVWRQMDFELSVDGANGEVVFEEDGTGEAGLTARVLNGETVADPIHIRALFTPGSPVEFHSITLDVPEISLTGVGIEEILGSRASTGSFGGTVTYRQRDDTPIVTVRGSLRDARLEELTEKVPSGPWHGTANIDVSEAVVACEEIEKISFSGELSDVRMQDLAGLLGQPDLTGTVSLSVEQLRYADGQLRYLSAAAEAADVSMAAVTRLIGHGVITGTLLVKVNSIVIVDGTVRWADISLDVIPPADQPGTIDRDMILFAGSEILGVDLGSARKYLPEAVEYVRLGCRLLVENDKLTVAGTHGADGKTLLTVRLFGQELGIIRQPRRVFAVSDLLDYIRRKAADYDVQHIRRILKQQ